ncbi:hypothetical protein Pmani_037634 [Petrolisthes manimaculis]|uniref:Uncharacterized protein n=1 Tax=Petrolisthes manimaculis TaxID=1843537 RepID=A0AAE1NHT6_9EUCA|nr:hypothetical protein Pmani_037634 [Petrolisthes manimaculis]
MRNVTQRAQEEGKTRTPTADIIFHMQRMQQRLSLASWTVQQLREIQRNRDVTPTKVTPKSRTQKDAHDHQETLSRDMYGEIRERESWERSRGEVKRQNAEETFGCLASLLLKREKISAEVPSVPQVEEESWPPEEQQQEEMEGLPSHDNSVKKKRSTVLASLCRGRA